MRSSELTQVILAGLNNNVFPCLWANPGYGKSEFVKTYAKDNNYEFIHINCHSLESTDLVLPSIVGSAVEFIPCSWVKKALEATKPLIIFLDELNRVKPENVNLLTTLVLEREVYGHRLPESTKFIAAANFNSKCAATMALDSAVMARFCHLLFDIPLTDSLPYMGSKQAQEFILASTDLIEESPQDADFVAEVLEMLEMNRRSLTWTLKMFESPELTLETRRAVAQGLLGVPEGSKIAAAYENFMNNQKNRFPTKIEGNEEVLGKLLNEGYVAEVTAIVQAAIDNESKKEDALCFIVNYGNPELTRNILVANKSIGGVMLPTKKLKLKENVNLEELQFMIALGSFTDLLRPR